MQEKKKYEKLKMLIRINPLALESQDWSYK